MLSLYNIKILPIDPTTTEDVLSSIIEEKSFLLPTLTLTLISSWSHNDLSIDLIADSDNPFLPIII